MMKFCKIALVAVFVSASFNLAQAKMAPSEMSAPAKRIMAEIGVANIADLCGDRRGARRAVRNALRSGVGAELQQSGGFSRKDVTAAANETIKFIKSRCESM